MTHARSRRWSQGPDSPSGMVLADQHALFVEVLTAALVSAGHVVAATPTTGPELLAGVCQPTARLLIVESVFDGHSCVEWISEVGAVAPNVDVVVLTADEREECAQRSMAAGARAFVHKSRGLDTLIETLRRVRSGEVTLLPAIVPTSSAPDSHLRHLASYLTRRELDCLRLLAEGMDTAEMARELNVSTATIRSHVQFVLTKLGVHSRTEAASVAIRHGLVAAAGEGDAAARPARVQVSRAR